MKYLLILAIILFTGCATQVSQPTPCPCQDPQVSVLPPEMEKQIEYSENLTFDGKPLTAAAKASIRKNITDQIINSQRAEFGNQQIEARQKAIELYYAETGICPQYIHATPISKEYGDSHDIGCEVEIYQIDTTYYYFFDMGNNLVEHKTYPTHQWDKDNIIRWQSMGN